MVSADANFGLTRKKSASGSQLADPRYGNLYFVNQEKVQTSVVLDTNTKQTYEVSMLPNTCFFAALPSDIGEICL